MAKLRLRQTKDPVLAAKIKALTREKIAELEAEVVAYEAMEAIRREKIEEILRSEEVRQMPYGRRSP